MIRTLSRLAAVAVLLAGLSFGGLTAQRPGQEPSAFPLAWAVPTLVVAALTGLALGRWGRLAPPPVEMWPKADSSKPSAAQSPCRDCGSSATPS